MMNDMKPTNEGLQTVDATGRSNGTPPGDSRQPTAIPLVPQTPPMFALLPVELWTLILDFLSDHRQCLSGNLAVMPTLLALFRACWWLCDVAQPVLNHHFRSWKPLDGRLNSVPRLYLFCPQPRRTFRSCRKSTA